MKPVSVRFKCFGPYVAEQYIDFRELEKNGLFLICGETGAGKTTILDAMCYALYGRSSGGLRGDLSVMRCKLAEKTDETLVEFIFDSNGKRYKFVRSLKYGRKNLNDTHNCLVLQGEEYVPVFENPKATFVNKKAEELIGLSYDQFRQVIILPQGQFEKLLVSNSEEKEKILVSLFHADRWQRIADEIYRRVAERDAALKQEKVQISSKLRDYGCETLAELEEKRQEKQLYRDALKIQAAAAEKTVAGQRTLHETALLENQSFEELTRREKAYQDLLTQTAVFDSEEQTLKSADAAEVIRPQYTSYQDARARKLRAEGILEQKQKNLEGALQKLEEVQETQDAHTAARPAYEQQKKQIVLLENARELYRSLAEKEKAYDAARKSLRTAKDSASEAQRNFFHCDEAWQNAALQQSEAIQSYQKAQMVYLQGIGSVLAEQLMAGEPCPVCGSLEHPNPAKPLEGHITEAQLESLNQAMNQANDGVSAALQQRTGAETAKNQAETVLNQASQAAAVALTDYENALSRKIEGIDTEAALDIKIQVMTDAVNAFEQADSQLAKAVTDAESDLKVAKAEAETATKELLAAEAAYTAQLALWQDALANSGLENEDRFKAADMNPEEKQRRNEVLIRFRSQLSQAEERLHEQQEKLAGKTSPDLAAIKAALDAAGTESKTIAAQLALAEDTLKTMEEVGRSLTKRLSKYEISREMVNADLDFANRLRGRSGVSLQRYVLGVMLTSITAEANRLLANVYGGRYRLYRTDDIAGAARKSGLELEVYDSHNNQRRSVTTLSGGEKFLVALSLAIGLSTVVQAQGSGIRLEAMFIDEGFGSLDRDAVNDALEVLQGIQRSSGIVGIISHVEALAETIPAKIEIIKGKNGSKCVIRS